MFTRKYKIRLHIEGFDQGIGCSLKVKGSAHVHVQKGQFCYTFDKQLRHSDAYSRKTGEK